VAFDLRSARSLSAGERAELNNAAFAGYFVPFHVDEAAVTRMTEWFDLDLDASRIAFRDGEPVGFGMLGIRGEDAWIGGVGVVPAARRAGIGDALMRALHEEARAHGVRRVWLEVIVENTGALDLYDKLGYELVQDVEVWTLPGTDAELEAREVPAEEVRALIPHRHEPWQRADGTLAHYDDVRGLVTDDGAMLFCVRSTSAQLQQYAGEPEPLIRALRTFKDVYILNLPENDPAADVLHELGGTVTVRQHEMLLEL
jgi:ribosomal protein S18 acetylase RimI-like enzyme